MKRTIFTTTLLIITLSLFAQYNSGKQSIGLKLGDPVGLSYKKYSGNTGIELNIGRTYMMGRSNKYYNDYYKHWYDSKNYAYDNHELRSYDQSTPICVQLHLLRHTSIRNFDGHDLEEGLYWYYGFGGQFRYQTITYVYDYLTTTGWRVANTEKAVNLDLGVDLVAGLEYTFQDYPIALFLDLNLFVELIDNPFYLLFQPGIGGRYIF